MGGARKPGLFGQGFDARQVFVRCLLDLAIRLRTHPAGHRIANDRRNDVEVSALFPAEGDGDSFVADAIIRTIRRQQDLFESPNRRQVRARRHDVLPKNEFDGLSRSG